MTIIHWLFGPQLIGFIMLIAGYIQKIFPPKKINNLYGYRTMSSMKNQQTWDLANRYSANLLIKVGVVAIIAGLLLIQVIDIKHEYVMIIATLVILFVMIFTLMSLTEKKLKQTFGQPNDEVL